MTQRNKRQEFGKCADNITHVLYTESGVFCSLFAIVVFAPYMHNLALAHGGRDKMDIMLQMTFSDAFSWKKIYEFRLKFDWNVSLKVQLTIF